MSFSIEFAGDESQEYQARIKVVGCGGSGGNAINAMINFGLEGVEFVAINTDAQALNANQSPVRIPIGQAVTKGLGAGADPEKGRKAAMEDVTRIKEAISGADMVFVTAGMGGGTGTGAAPVVAQLAREEGALTVGVVTKPFEFEGSRRTRQAELGMMELADHVDTLITIPNEKLLLLEDDELSFIDAFRKADEVLYQAVKGISDLITQNGIVNVDFADVKTVMQNMGRALMGAGCAKGQGRARCAVETAINSPLLDNISLQGATGVLINFVGGPDLKLREMKEAATLVREQAHPDANIIWGASVDESMGEMIKVTVIATGFDREFGDTESRPVATARPVYGMPAQQAPARRTAYSIPAPAPVVAAPAARTSVAPTSAQFASRRPAPVAFAATGGFGSSEPPASLRIERTTMAPPAQSLDNEFDAPTFLRTRQ